MNRRISIFAVAMLIMCAVLGAGCGTPPKSAKQILSESLKSMEKITSTKAIAEYTITSKSSSGTDEMKLAMELELGNLKGKNLTGRMVTKSGKEKTEAYFKGGYIYTEVQGKGWVKSPTSSGDIPASPTQISELVKYAENIRLVSEEDPFYVVSFDLSDEYLTDQLKKESEAQQSSGTDIAKQMEDVIKTTKISATYTISKDKMLLSKTNLKFVMGDAITTVAVEFKNYNKPVKVNLPPQAMNAPVVEEIPTAEAPGL